jgi:hypothetical protein
MVRSCRGQRSSFAGKPCLGHLLFLVESLANKFSDGKDSPELREKERALRGILGEGGPRVQIPLGPHHQLSFFATSGRTDRNAGVCARFVIESGPGECPFVG